MILDTKLYGLVDLGLVALSVGIDQHTIYYTVQ
jgi:hypothetical protein